MQPSLPEFRADIQTLRALAVFAVIGYHLGITPGGYLGVDVFFVLSGYLITQQLVQKKYNLREFYTKRFRRIVPLSLLVTTLSLMVGCLVMLPDDLENLGQSVLATHFFANNWLLLVTSKFYWNNVNAFKPLLHTWSLGIEEQFYLIYPLLFLLSSKWKQLILFIASFVSLLLFLSWPDEAFRFYSLPTRFFELGAGGIAASYAFGYRPYFSWLSLVMIVLCFSLPVQSMGSSLALITVLSTVTILVHQPLSNKILANKIVLFAGAISYSLYMWHQPLLAFIRYTFAHELSIALVICYLIALILLSSITYFFIEQPFRNTTRISTRVVMISCLSLFLFSSIVTGYVLLRKGIIRDVPELDYYTNRPPINHEAFNHRILTLPKTPSSSNQVHILIVGNSFARDWANVLLSSSLADSLDICYVTQLNELPEDLDWNAFDYIFFSAVTKEQVNTWQQQYSFSLSKVWVIGTKTFGPNMGIIYQKRNSDEYTKQVIKPDTYHVRLNQMLAYEWGNRYINQMQVLNDGNGNIQVFTPQGKLISADGKHYTPAGAAYVGSLLPLHSLLKKEARK